MEKLIKSVEALGKATKNLSKPCEMVGKWYSDKVHVYFEFCVLVIILLILIPLIAMGILSFRHKPNNNENI